MTDAEPVDERLAAAMRQLALVDEVIGLRAQLAETTVRHQVRLAQATEDLEETRALLHRARLADAELRAELLAARSEADRVQADLTATHGSWTWRLGLAATAPVRLLQRRPFGHTR